MSSATLFIFFLRLVWLFGVPSIFIKIVRLVYQFMKNPPEILIGNTFKSVEQFGESCYLNNVSLLIHEHEKYFHLLRSSVPVNKIL